MTYEPEELRVTSLDQAVRRAEALIGVGIPVNAEAIVADAQKFQDYLQGNGDRANLTDEQINALRDGRNENIPGYGEAPVVTAMPKPKVKPASGDLIVPEDLMEAVTNYVVETGMRATSVPEIREVIARILGVAYHNDRGGAVFKK